MVKIKLYNKMYMFYCPGCGFLHGFHNKRWKFNQDLNNPTFRPSLLVNALADRCHLLMTNGKIKYLTDCHHELAGQTVQCPDWEE